MASRELYEIRKKLSQSHSNDFLTVGSMGHASSIAMGLAISRPDKKIICIDGDGAALMHLGALPIIGCKKLKNMTHILINNGAHDSVGGQPTVGLDIPFVEIAKQCGYEDVFTTNNLKTFEEKLNEIQKSEKNSFIEIKVKKGARADLGRPTSSPKKKKLYH